MHNLYQPHNDCKHKKGVVNETIVCPTRISFMSPLILIPKIKLKMIKAVNAKRNAKKADIISDHYFMG